MISLRIVISLRLRIVISLAMGLFCALRLHPFDCWLSKYCTVQYSCFEKVSS